MGKISRREFTVGAATLSAGLLTSRSAGAVQGANERLRVGFIGVGNRGGQLLGMTLKNTDVEVVALCDVYKPHLDKWTVKVGGNVKEYGDFRQLIERKDLDAVFIATPDHWHAIQAIAACDAGKDVYVEKPLSITIQEGRRMVEAARRNNRIVQVGLQRRSSPLYARIARLVQDNTLGKITVARAYRLSNMYPNGIGVAPDAEPPNDLDWNLWLGPRPKRAYNPTIAPYKFRWWKAYSSQLANWGVHYFDAIRWVLNETAPVSVSAHGGKFALQDARDIPDTLEVTFEFASGRLLVFGQYEASGVPALKSGEIELRGTLGALYADQNRYEIVPEKGGQFQDPDARLKAVTVQNEKNEDEALHVRNFLDCVKSRRTPNCDIEQGHRSTTFAHLGNIALATRARLDWDPHSETFTNNKTANSLLHYRYREPWELK